MNISDSFLLELKVTSNALKNQYKFKKPEEILEICVAFYKAAISFPFELIKASFSDEETEKFETEMELKGLSKLGEGFVSRKAIKLLFHALNYGESKEFNEKRRRGHRFIIRELILFIIREAPPLLQSKLISVAMKSQTLFPPSESYFTHPEPLNISTQLSQLVPELFPNKLKLFNTFSGFFSESKHMKEIRQEASKVYDFFTVFNFDNETILLPYSFFSSLKLSLSAQSSLPNETMNFLLNYFQRIQIQSTRNIELQNLYSHLNDTRFSLFRKFNEVILWIMKGCEQRGA